MRAIDTNVLVRYLTGDHPQHSALARSVIDSGAIFVGDSVLLEGEWVLRSVYGYSRQEVANSLRAFVGLPNVAVENAELLAQVFERTQEGFDFADALHLGAAAHCEEFLSFDKQIVLQAEQTKPTVREP